MERHWRFIYDRERTCGWVWQVRDDMRVRMASLGGFDTLDRCMNHARDNGFTIGQRYEIVFGNAAATERRSV